jgi:hypothetical protein
MKPSKPRAAPLDILAAMNSPALFGPQFHGESWNKWRAFLAALFGLSMDAANMAAFTEHTGRVTAPVAPFKEAALICGRRGGKSRVLALVAVYIACFVDHTPHLSAGEVATVAIIAADRKQARTILLYVTGLLRSVPALAAMIDGETAESISLSNRVTIEIATASFKVTRGYTLAAVLSDEIAFWQTSEDSAVPDTDILRALRPGMSSIPHSMLLLASSPYAKRGALWDAYKRHHGRDDARVLVWQGSTAAMNPSIDPAIIAEAYEADAASAAAEYGAEFRSDIAAFVDRAVVESCIMPGRFELPRRSGVQYRAFVDPSGGSADSFTLAIAHNEAGLSVLDSVREVRLPFSPDGTVRDFAALLKSYGISAVIGDRYAGEWPRERFRAHGIQYQLAEKPCSDLYRDMLPMLNSGQCELLDIPRLTSQLCALERRTARSGRDSIGHPPSGHDDIANAVAGALLLCRARPAMRISAAALANNAGPRRSFI